MTNSYNRIVIKSNVNRFVYHLEDLTSEKPIQIQIVPFRKPGTYDLDILVQGEGCFDSIELIIGFVDYQWGRDNFSFANDSEFRKRLDLYSEQLFSWLKDRFGEIPMYERVLLIHHMYSLFGKTAGRCYAFSGSQQLYYLYPDLLPRYYDTIYELREYSPSLQKKMNYLQMDMVFDRFIAHGDSFDGIPGRPETEHGSKGLLTPMSREEIVALMKKLQKHIDMGKPTVLGLLAEEFHHSMFIYGYILNKTYGTIDLIAANNWERNQEVNIHSENTHNIRLYINQNHEGPRIEWWDRDGIRKRKPTRLLIVNAKKTYDHTYADIRSLTDKKLTLLRKKQRALLLVEEAKEAYLLSENEKITGYKRYRTKNEIKDVNFRKVQACYIFDFPAKTVATLKYKGTKDTNIFYFSSLSDTSYQTIARHQPESIHTIHDRKSKPISNIFSGPDAKEPTLSEVKLTPQGISYQK